MPDRAVDLRLMPSARHDLPRWLAAAIGIGLTCGALLAFAWWLHSPWATLAGHPASFDGRTTLTTLDEFFREPQPGNLIDRMVRLRSAPVQRVAGNYLFWIGTGVDRRIPVVLFGELTQRQPEGATRVEPNSEVSILGTVRPLTDVSSITSEGWLSAREREALASAVYFISADRVVTTANVEPSR